ncbi:hypothetical protein BSL78_20453 [Apostichopus japonicus]|uniref:Dirigent protein n=1 Tax=Stichopus japonicus TaxID=307972 RepID=A0A2G8K3V3_STIJA|nr:hypothetical protein BSL78_20453 [Apostichopus japonicus]
MASYTNGNKIFGLFCLLAFIILSSSQTTTATSHRLRSLYLRMLVSCNQLKVSRDELSSAITQTRDVSGVIHHSSVDSISGLNAHLGDVGVFDQEEDTSANNTHQGYATTTLRTGLRHRFRLMAMYIYVNGRQSQREELATSAQDLSKADIAIPDRSNVGLSAHTCQWETTALVSIKYSLMFK